MIRADKTQDLPRNAHGSVWSEFTTGQRQPGHTGDDGLEFCLVGRGEHIREHTWMGLEGYILPGGEERREEHSS